MIWLIQLFIVSLFLRDNIYFGDTAISLMNVINLIVFGYISFCSRTKISKNFLLIIYAVLIFFIIEFIYLIFFYRSIDQIKEFYYSSYLFSLFLLIYWGIRFHYQNFVKKTFHTLFYLYFVIFFVVLYELFTKHHLPGSRASYDEGFRIYPTAFFYNPNDFAVVISLFLPLLYYFSQILKERIKFYIIFLLSLFFIIATLSRLSLFFLLLFPVFILFIKNKMKYLSILVGIFVILITLLMNIDLKKYSKGDSLMSNNIAKFSSILDDSGVNPDNSILNNIRYRVFTPIFHSPQNYLFGSGFVSSAELYEKKIIPLENPHSYWAEGIFNFGFIGFSPILFILISILLISSIQLNKHYFYRYSLVQLFYFIFLLNIPSSVMSLPVVWIPISILTGLLFNFKNDDILAIEKIE